MPSPSFAPPDASSRSDDLPIDLGRLESILTDPLPTLDPADSIFPDDRQGPLLRRYVARCYLRELLATCAEGFALLPDDVRPTLRTAILALQRLPADAMLEAALRPAVTAWIYLANDAVARAHAARFAEIARELSHLLLGDLLRGGALAPGEVLEIPTAPRSALRLYACAQEIQLPPCVGPLQLRVTSLGAAVELRNGVGSWQVDAAEIRRGGGARWTARGVGPRRLPQVDPGGLVVLASDPWFESRYPRGAHTFAAELCHDVDDASVRELLQGLDAGMSILEEHWLEAFAEVRRTVEVILRIQGSGLSALNESVRAFRGLVTTTARPSYLAAQTLVHEAAHNRLSSLLEVFRLVENGPEESYYSPFVRAPRPMENLIHGVFSFLQDVHVSRRLVGKVDEIPGHELEPYAEALCEKISETLRTIRAHAKLTPAGEGLMSGLEKSLGALS